MRNVLGLSMFCTALSVAVNSYAADGITVFRDNCAACHQANARGALGVAPPLIGSHWNALQNRQENYILQVLSAGLTGKITVNGESFNGAMPSFKYLDAEDVAAVGNYVLSLNKLEGETPVVTVRDVMAAREKNMKPAQVRALRQTLVKE
jgi:mono/diheme cytochrome c family protein